jgi:hypothetical protein
MWNPDASAPKLTTPLAAPANYFELTFTAQAGVGYRLWLRGRAERDYYGNDSVYVQFSGSVNATGIAENRIGTTSAAAVSIEDCSGCGLAGWGWQDNAYGVGSLGPLVYFATAGRQTIRIQQREDGVSIDQIILSPAQFLTTAPGLTKNDATVYPATPLSIREVVLRGADTSRVAGAWRLVADASASGGVAVWHPDAGAPKVTTPLASPVNFIELTFQADAGRAYRLWIRGRADADYWGNDSVFVQFGNSVDASGAAIARIGSIDAYVVNLEDASGAGLSGWGWQDNGYGAGVLGPVITFATAGTQTVRIQTREDGLRIDQVVLSSEKYLASAPGALKNDSTILK